MSRASCLACLALASLAVPALAEKVTEMPVELKAALDRSERIQELLLRGEWAPAEAEARAGLAADVEHPVEDPAKLLALLSVVEEKQGRYDDAAWHWQEVQAMTGTADLSSFGAPALVAKIPARRLDEAPAGLAVRKEGDGGPPLTPARRVSGEAAKLPGSRRPMPLGIRVQVIVDAEGRVRQPVVAASTSAILTYVVLEAMRGWRFTPAQQAAGRSPPSTSSTSPLSGHSSGCSTSRRRLGRTHPALEGGELRVGREEGRSPLEACVDRAEERPDG